MECTILSDNDIQLITALTQHKERIEKVIAPTQNRFASCSDKDGTVKLFNGRRGNDH